MASGMDRFRTERALLAHVTKRLDPGPRIGKSLSADHALDPTTSAVLFLLGRDCSRNGFDPCLILNKRSGKVRQPGDLCCPGGSVSQGLDSVLARLFALPGFPLGRWPMWSEWRRRYPRSARGLALLLATSLRESFEEMRLNPFGVKFIGPLPAQRLVMFRREIFPMAAWSTHQKRFFPNWEVEKIVRIPLRTLLDPDLYAVHRIRFASVRSAESARPGGDFPCFVHHGKGGTELLWGVTYRIVTTFLERVFDFRPPDPESLPVHQRVLENTYAGSPR